MTASVHLATDRSDFRTVMVAGTKVGAITGAAVIVYLLASRFLPAGPPRRTVEALIVLATGCAVSFLPARWTAARTADGIAGAAAAGFWGTVVFMAIDIVLLRPFKAYPWTWDAVGGGSSWWYLPPWWMLGTFTAWMGAILTASRAARGGAGLVQVASPVVVGAVVLAVIARVVDVGFSLPTATGAAFVVALTLFALAALARKP
ncbi:MAG: hypothetical protein ACREMV_01775 [Gemmatimonadales bacterium]